MNKISSTARAVPRMQKALELHQEDGGGGREIPLLDTTPSKQDDPGSLVTRILNSDGLSICLNLQDTNHQMLMYSFLKTGLVFS